MLYDVMMAAVKAHKPALHTNQISSTGGEAHGAGECTAKMHRLMRRENAPADVACPAASIAVFPLLNSALPVGCLSTPPALAGRNRPRQPRRRTPLAGRRRCGGLR